jgi:hypothetical protein
MMCTLVEIKLGKVDDFEIWPSNAWVIAKFAVKIDG